MSAPPHSDPSHLLEQLGHLTHQAGVGLHLTLVSVGQEEVPEQGGVREGLDDAVHEARVAQVDQPSQPCGGGREGWLGIELILHGSNNSDGV